MAVAGFILRREQFLFLPGIYQFLLNLIGKEEKNREE